MAGAEEVEETLKEARSGREGTEKAPVGSHVVDGRTGRVGIVMGHVGPYLQLRPYGGGREWDAEPGAVRLATPAERLSAATAYANARNRGEVP